MRYVTITDCPNCKYGNIVISDKKLSDPITCQECNLNIYEGLKTETFEIETAYDYNQLKKYFKPSFKEVLSDNKRFYKELTKGIRPTSGNTNSEKWEPSQFGNPNEQ